MKNLYCRGKRSYDKRGAVTVANKRFKDDRVKLRIYPCEDCNMWHVTKQLRKGKPKSYR